MSSGFKSSKLKVVSDKCYNYKTNRNKLYHMNSTQTKNVDGVRSVQGVSQFFGDTVRISAFFWRQWECPNEIQNFPRSTLTKIG